MSSWRLVKGNTAGDVVDALPLERLRQKAHGTEGTVMVVRDQDWTSFAKCRGTKDDMFGDAHDQKRARLLCVGCPVRFECLAEALDSRIEWGVWGGMTERERRSLLRQRADISSWTSALRLTKAA